MHDSFYNIKESLGSEFNHCEERFAKNGILMNIEKIENPK